MFEHRGGHGNHGHHFGKLVSARRRQDKATTTTVTATTVTPTTVTATTHT